MRSGATENAGVGELSRSVLLLVWPAVALAVAGIAAWYLLASKQLAGEFGLPLDDGWIHARFAQNLARGQGFSFNPGEPTSTTTSPLWTLLLSVGYRLTGEHLFTSIAINFALSMLLCAAIYKLSLLLVPRPWLALAAAGAAAVTVPLPWWLLSGMEPPLYAVLAIAGIALHIALRAVRGWKSLLPTVVFALAGLARPEMMLLFPLAMVDRLVMSLLDRQEGPLRRWGRALCLHLPIFAVLVAPMFAYNWRVTGYLLPTSFYSKLQRVGIPGALADSRLSWWSALAAGPAREVGEVWRVWAADNCVLIVPFFVGFVWLIWQAAKRADRGGRSLLIPMLLLVQPVAWALSAGYRPPSSQSQRYIADLNPLFILLGMLGGWVLVERIPGLRRPGLRVFLFAAVLLASLARQPGGVETYAKNVRDTTQMQVAVGRWLRDNAPPGSLLAVNDIGAIGFIAGLPVLDLQGLVTPEILPLRDFKRRLDGTAPRAVFEFIIDRRPDYLIIFPQWYPELDARRDLFLPEFWVALDDNVTNGAPLMVVYRTAWAGHGERRGRPTS